MRLADLLQDVRRVRAAGLIYDEDLSYRSRIYSHFPSYIVEHRAPRIFSCLESKIKTADITIARHDTINDKLSKQKSSIRYATSSGLN